MRERGDWRKGGGAVTSTKRTYLVWDEDDSPEDGVTISAENDWSAATEYARREDTGTQHEDWVVYVKDDVGLVSCFTVEIRAGTTYNAVRNT